MEKFLDIFGVILWLLMFAAPLAAFLIAWKLIEGSKAVKIVSGLILAIVISLFLYCISLSIMFRNGLGPG